MILIITALRIPTPLPKKYRLLPIYTCSIACDTYHNRIKKSDPYLTQTVYCLCILAGGAAEAGHRSGRHGWRPGQGPRQSHGCHARRLG